MIQSVLVVAMKFLSIPCAIVFLVILGVGCERAENPAPSDSDQAVEVNPGMHDPLAQHLCDTLHTLPETRKAQCCGTTASSTLIGECARTLSTALRNKTVTINRSEVDRCREDASRKFQGCNWVTPLAPSMPESCRNILQGQLDLGAGCHSSLECKEGLFCQGGGPTRTGTCAEPGAVGAACGGPADTLTIYTGQIGYEVRHPECAGLCRAGRCAPFQALGEACSSSLQCGPQRHCRSGRCTEGSLPTLGEDCQGTTCATGRCVEGQCVALKAAGESCTSPFECQAACVIPVGAAVGTCGMKCSQWPLTLY